jgi:hypothetical protein
MTRFIAADPIAESFLLDGAVTGETFTVTNAIGPGGVWAGPVITEVGSGVYQATGSMSGTETGVGFYQATITGNTTGQAFTLTWEVVGSPSASFTRRASGQVIAPGDVNELQQALEAVQALLGVE